MNNFDIKTIKCQGNSLLWATHEGFHVRLRNSQNHQMGDDISMKKYFLGAANQLNIQIAGKIGIEIAEETTARALLEEIVLKKRIWQSDNWAIWRSGDMAIMVNRRLANWPIGRSDYSAIW